MEGYETEEGGTERKLKFVHFRATSISLDQKLVQILNLIIMDFTIAFKKSQKMDFMNHKNTQFYYQCILYPKKTSSKYTFKLELCVSFSSYVINR